MSESLEGGKGSDEFLGEGIGNGGCGWGEALEEEMIVMCHAGIVESGRVIGISCEFEEDIFGVSVFEGSS